ncbi:6617_t:CDS:2, partial [Gigaspora margarita]
HVIAYTSRTLTPAKSNYSTVELECLVVIWALLNSTTINNNKRITRWKMSLQEYQFDVKYQADLQIPIFIAIQYEHLYAEKPRIQKEAKN